MKRLWSYFRQELNSNFMEYVLAFALVAIVLIVLVDILNMSSINESSANESRPFDVTGEPLPPEF